MRLPGATECKAQQNGLQNVCFNHTTPRNTPEDRRFQEKRFSAVNKFLITKPNTRKFNVFLIFFKFIIYVRGDHCDFSLRAASIVLLNVTEEAGFDRLFVI